MPPPTPASPAAAQTDDQEKLLEEALQVVKQQAFQMNRALDGNKLMEALKFASTMLCELRTSLLSPKAYYELYMAISDELRRLEMFLVDEFNKGHKVSDLYELVQYAGNIVPRLYLLVTVGSVYIKSKQVPTKDILKDLVEMCRGVQHPLRGLFLRNFLLQSIKRDLPEEDLGDNHGNVHDSIDFILLNFAEMNKLWVRMQHQGHTRDKTKRENERRELRILVGTNLVRLSALEKLTVSIYREKVLPAFVDQIVSCRDEIAQEYLLECIIQVFPDEFHLQTLAEFLDVCGKVHSSVNIKNIIIVLIDRLAAYALREGSEIPAGLQLFDVFSTQIAKVIAERDSGAGDAVKMSPEDIVSLQLSLANLARKCYADRIDFIDKVLEFTNSYLHGRNIENVDHSAPVCKPLVKLAKFPVEEYPSVQTALSLEHHQAMMGFFAYNVRRSLAVDIARDVVTKETQLTTVEHVTSFLDLVMPLVKDMPEQPGDLTQDEDFAEEQHLLSRVLTLAAGTELDTQFQILSTARKQLGAGGEHRIKFTWPTLVFKALQLARAYHAAAAQDPQWEKKVQRIYKFVHESITALVKAECHDLALRLFLQAALTTDKTPFDKSESIAYEFMSQAFQIYEEEISDSKAQISAIRLIIATLESTTCFTDDNFTPLSTKCALVSSKLVGKPDQVRGVAYCTHLFWSGKIAGSTDEKQDSKQVLQCLQRGLKVASNLVEPLVQLQLYVEMFDKYVYYYEKRVDTVLVGHLNKICQMIREGLERLEPGEETDSISKNFQNILTHIQQVKATPGANAPDYGEFKG